MASSQGNATQHIKQPRLPLVIIAYRLQPVVIIRFGLTDYSGSGKGWGVQPLNVLCNLFAGRIGTFWLEWIGLNRESCVVMMFSISEMLCASCNDRVETNNRRLGIVRASSFNSAKTRCACTNSRNTTGVSRMSLGGNDAEGYLLKIGPF